MRFNRRITSILLAACLLQSYGSNSSSLSFETTSVDRGVDLIRDEAGHDIGLYRGSYALVIGVSEYTGGWPSLPGVRDDVKAVIKILKKHGFYVEVVEDPNHSQLEASYRNFINQFGMEPDNRLLFYFAGHGHTHKPSYASDDREEWLGYIVSSDAPIPDTDYSGFRNSAMSMRRFEELALGIEAKHALFVFDSCFSGSVFSIARSIPEAINENTAKPVRQFITAGDADQKVPDVSIFRRQFVAALEGEGDLSNDGYVTATELGFFLNEKVTNYSRRTQTPQYGKIRNRKLDKGNFVFVLPDAKGPSFQVNYVYRPAGKGPLKPIRPGTVLHSGDYYKIMFTPDERAYVYLFQSDSKNQFFQLFPMTNFNGVSLDNRNPVLKGKNYILPAPHKSFQLDDTTGHERFYFVSSKEPIMELEKLADKLRLAQKRGQEQLAKKASKDVESFFRGKRGLAAVVEDRPESKVEVPWEAGLTFPVFKERLEQLCPNCVYITEFKHKRRPN